MFQEAPGLSRRKQPRLVILYSAPLRDSRSPPRGMLLLPRPSAWAYVTTLQPLSDRRRQCTTPCVFGHRPHTGPMFCSFPLLFGLRRLPTRTSTWLPTHTGGALHALGAFTMRLSSYPLAGTGYCAFPDFRRCMDLGLYRLSLHLLVFVMT